MVGWLTFSDIETNANEHCIMLLKALLNQNYFQFDKQYYKPNKGIALPFQA